VSDAPKGPRVILEEAAPRLDFQWEQAVVPVAAPQPRGRWSGLGRAAAGAAVLGVGLAALDAANFVVDQFGRGPLQGWATLGVVVAGFGLLASGAWRELRSLAALRAVDQARVAFARQDLETARAEALRWAGGVAEAASLQPALRQAGSTEELRALLEGGPLRLLDAEAAGLGRVAAVQAFSVTAVSPSPGLDALIFAWRGVRLVRQVAALHGLRPGFIGTIALLRRTLFDAAAVAATDVAVDAAARALLSNKLLEQFAGEAAAGAVAARRMLRLARVAAEACRIVPPRG
jgi:putative membrane protein